MKIFVTGGAGYVGSKLVPELLKLGHDVTVLDLMIYGENVLDNHKKLKKIKGDIRNIDLFKKIIPGHDALLHLACISNDPSFELNPGLGKSINYDAFEPLVKVSKDNNVNRFIYASSSSVYGIKKEKNVTEDMKLQPLTEYSKFKGECEKILNNYKSDDFVVTTLRPSTVCGYARRQRLDLVVNILTNHAFHNRHIKVFGGKQLRPNLHIQDYCNVIELLMNAPKEKVNDEVFNVGFQNMSIMEIANLVKNVVEEMFPEKKPIKIVKTESDDNRSYHINSDKIKKILGFVPENTIEDAVRELCLSFKKGLIPNSFEDNIYYNVKRLKELKVK